MNWHLRCLTFTKDDTAFLSWNYIRIIGNGRINFYSSSGNFSQNDKLQPYDWLEKKLLMKIYWTRKDTHCLQQKDTAI
jgi:outer membrane protease